MAFLDLKIVLVAFVWLVDEVECHCHSLKPFSTITNRPNGIRLRKFAHESLNKWIAVIASLCGINKSQNWRFSQVVGLGCEKALVIGARFYPGSRHNPSFPQNTSIRRNGPESRRALTKGSLGH